MTARHMPEEAWSIASRLTARRCGCSDSEPDPADLSDWSVAFHRNRGNDLQTALRLAKLLGTSGLEVIAHLGYNIVAALPGLRPPPWAARAAILRDGVAQPKTLSVGSARSRYGTARQ